MATIDAFTRPRAARSQDRPTDATPVKHRALSLALDAVQIRLDTSAPDGWRARRLHAQKFALERLAGVPRLDARGRRV
jgi:hypothetical protein